MSQQVAQAYDNLAPAYDQQIKGDEWIREELWQLYLRRFRPGMDVLDVACGTGIDSLFLARQGINVTGVDVSPGMIAQLQRKAQAEKNGLSGRLETAVSPIEGLANWPSGRFDGIISGFAGLNTVADLGSFAATAAHLLRPGGGMVLHLINRFSLWEWLGLLAQRRWSAARYLGRQRERTFVISGLPVQHFISTAGDTYRYFAPYFQLRQSYGLALFRPPYGVLPFLAAGLGRLEKTVSHRRPFMNWGRFFVLDLARRDEERRT